MYSFIGAAGGLTNLTKMPSCNILVLGAQRKTLSGFSSVATNPHTGYIFYSDLVQGTTPVSNDFLSVLMCFHDKSNKRYNRIYFLNLNTVFCQSSIFLMCSVVVSFASVSRWYQEHLSPN